MRRESEGRTLGTNRNVVVLLKQLSASLLHTADLQASHAGGAKEGRSSFRAVGTAAAAATARLTNRSVLPTQAADKEEAHHLLNGLGRGARAAARGRRPRHRRPL